VPAQLVACAKFLCRIIDSFGITLIYLRLQVCSHGFMFTCIPQFSLLFSLMERKEKKNYASSKKLLTSIKEKGPLWKKSPFTRKEKGGQ